VLEFAVGGVRLTHNFGLVLARPQKPPDERSQCFLVSFQTRRNGYKAEQCQQHRNKLMWSLANGSDQQPEKAYQTGGWDDKDDKKNVESRVNRTVDYQPEQGSACHKYNE
jgi:hypothetical protein